MTEPLIQLKPCPFCGSKDVAVNYHNINQSDWWVFCRDCDGSGPTDLGESGACEAWNERLIEAQLLEAIKDLLAGYELNYAGDDVRYTFSPEEWDRRIDACKAAIAAAEGAP